MDAEAYCNEVEKRLGHWKARAGDVSSKAEALGEGKKKQTVEDLANLGVIVEEIEAWIHRLRRECPADWSEDKIKMEAHMGDLEEALSRITGSLGSS